MCQNREITREYSPTGEQTTAAIGNEIVVVDMSLTFGGTPVA